MGTGPESENGPGFRARLRTTPRTTTLTGAATYLAVASDTF